VDPVQLEQARQLGDRVGHRIDRTTGDGLWHQHSLRAQPLQEHNHRRGIGSLGVSILTDAARGSWMIVPWLISACCG
jgi:hypothetical protein